MTDNVRLVSLEYEEYRDLPQWWRLERTEMAPVTLLVGKNATGKTRTLNVLAGLTNILAKEPHPLFANGHFKIVLSVGIERLSYELNLVERQVVTESLYKNDQPLLLRREGGFGRIYNVKSDALEEFQTPPGNLAAQARRDSVQHPFLEPMTEWATSCRHLQFSRLRGNEALVVFVKGPKGQANDDQRTIVGMLRRGMERFPDFKARLMEEMGKLGYQIDDIGWGTILSDLIQPSPMANSVGLWVKESDLDAPTGQTSMSDGMFRALGTLIAVNYSVSASNTGLLLVDDIGEGLDFERTCKLIDLLVEKATASSIQLLMASNDRFVMNRVPLEMWALMRRSGPVVEAFLPRNHPALFKEFKLTGLNNFDFFSMDFDLHNSLEKK